MKLRIRQCRYDSADCTQYGLAFNDKDGDDDDDDDGGQVPFSIYNYISYCCHIYGHMDTGRLFIHMHVRPPVLIIQIINYLIIIMITVSQRGSFHGLFCFFRGIKAVLEKPLLNLENKENTLEEKYHQGLRKLMCQIRVGNTNRFS